MSNWRLAKSLETLRAQINAALPDRDRSSDGSIGDASHQSRGSDHNAWIKDGSGGPNVVSAIDLTHDPAGGFDSYKFADYLLRRRDPRIKYVISNSLIGGSIEHPPWTWANYHGTNPHNHHVHVSVLPFRGSYDDVHPWDIGKLTPTGVVARPPRPLLRRGATGVDVSSLQALLVKRGYVLPINGEFGPETEAAVKAFQSRSSLVADGVVGGYTWRALA